MQCNDLVDLRKVCNHLISRAYGTVPRGLTGLLVGRVWSVHVYIRAVTELDDFLRLGHIKVLF